MPLLEVYSQFPIGPLNLGSSRAAAKKVWRVEGVTAMSTSFLLMLKGQGHAKWLVAPLKGRTGQTVADGSGFSDVPVTATMADPLAMATRKTKNNPTVVKRSRSRNPGAGPRAIGARSTKHRRRFDTLEGLPGS